MRLDKNGIDKILYFRKRGYSIPELSRECNVSKSTALRYSKRVKILPAYYKRWLERRNASKIISEKNWALAEEKANKIINIINKDNFILIPVLLYWAEGSKKDFSFSNTDPNMIKIFIYSLENFLGVKKEDIIVSLRIYEDLNKKECLKFWSEITGIKLNQNTSINVIKGSKNGKLKYGMCRVRVKKGGLLLKEVFSIINRLCQLISPRSSMDRMAHS